MKLLMKLLGILFVFAGISLYIDQEIIFGWIDHNSDSKLLYTSAILARILLGALFIIAAQKSRFPITIKFIGYVMLIAAIVFVLMGSEKFAMFVASTILSLKPYAFMGGIFSLVFGAFIIYAFSAPNIAKQA